MAKEILLNQVRQNFLAKINEVFSNEEILVTGSNEIAIPTVDSEGNELFVTIKVSIPKGSRDGEPYDGYGVAQAYKMSVDLKEKKAKVAAEDKAKKIARDKAAREEKARLAKEKEA